MMLGYLYCLCLLALFITVSVNCKTIATNNDLDLLDRQYESASGSVCPFSRYRNGRSTYTTTPCRGTPTDFMSIFLGRCHAYQELYPELFINDEKDCKDLWHKFLSAFQYKDPCNVHHQAYSAFTKAAAHTLPQDTKITLWEGVGGFVHDYTNQGRRMYGVQNTLTAYVIDGMAWCGQKTYPGMNSETCPWCDQSPVITFWRQASTEFAERLSDNVYLILNGSRPEGAVRKESIFSLYELPNLVSGRVHTLHAIIVHDLDKPKVESCGGASLAKLQQNLEAKGIKYECTNDQQDLHLLLCVDKPSSSSCQLKTTHKYIRPNITM